MKSNCKSSDLGPCGWRWSSCRISRPPMARLTPSIFVVACFSILWCSWFDGARICLATLCLLHMLSSTLLHHVLRYILLPCLIFMKDLDHTPRISTSPCFTPILFENSHLREKATAKAILAVQPHHPSSINISTKVQRIVRHRPYFQEPQAPFSFRHTYPH